MGMLARSESLNPWARGLEFHKLGRGRHGHLSGIYFFPIYVEVDMMIIEKVAFFVFFVPANQTPVWSHISHFDGRRSIAIGHLSHLGGLKMYYLWLRLDQYWISLTTQREGRGECLKKPNSSKVIWYNFLLYPYTTHLFYMFIT